MNEKRERTEYAPRQVEHAATVEDIERAREARRSAQNTDGALTSPLDTNSPVTDTEEPKN